MTKMLGRILGEDIALQFNYSPNLPLVHADAGMTEQVLLNLAVNSRDAMPSGGQLTIRILVLALKADDLKKHPEGRVGDFACLSVEDTGCGIEPKDMARIFEPFFTTKEVGKGTGLGLATVYGIVKQHQGWVEVESQVGRGTTFHVFLPCLREVTATAEPETMVPEAVRGGTETILVVEDEEAVRELVCHVLKGCGYTVLEAASGVEAMKVWQAHKDEIDLLLTDIVMPDGMTGRDLAEKVQTEKPWLKGHLHQRLQRGHRRQGFHDPRRRELSAKALRPPKAHARRPQGLGRTLRAQYQFAVILHGPKRTCFCRRINPK